jgi:hypothetical protein
MARNRKGPPDQAKHFQHDDHEHAAHQEEASHGQGQTHRPRSDEDRNSGVPKTGHPMEITPKGPSKGQ